MAKHHFAPWSWDRSALSGLASVAIQDGDAHSHCTRCNVTVKVAKGSSVTKFWVAGKWTSKRPVCTPPAGA